MTKSCVLPRHWDQFRYKFVVSIGILYLWNMWELSVNIWLKSVFLYRFSWGILNLQCHNRGCIKKVRRTSCSHDRILQQETHGGSYYYFNKVKAVLALKGVIFVLPPNVVWPEAYCFWPGHPYVRLCVSQNIISTTSCGVFDTFSPNLHQRCIAGEKWMLHNFRVKRWKVKVTM